MKIEHLLVQHFYNTKEVTLQGMGTFRLSADFVIPMENDKETVMPENAISFQYNSRATEDDALINFIVQQTHKIKPLASADLDSYLVLGKQFLNIGKPFRIEGLGLLEKNQQGEYQFTQGHFSNSKLETAPNAVKEKVEEDDISFASETKQSTIRKKILLIAAIVIGLGMIGAAGWYFFMRKTVSPEQTSSAPPPVLNEVAAKTDTAKTDTSKINAVIPDSSLLNQAPATTSGYTFKVVFRVLSRSGAIKKMAELKKSNVVMYTTDSIHYKLAEQFTRPLSDTTRVKDSLRVFYDFRTFIEFK